MVEIPAWPGSGVGSILDSLVAQGSSQYRELRLDDGESDAWLDELRRRRNREVRWWIARQRLPESVQSGFAAVRRDGQHLLWVSEGRSIRRVKSAVRWRAERLLLSEVEIIGLGRLPGHREVGFEEARRLREVTDGWFEPVRRILAALGEDEEVPRSPAAALAIAEVHEFVVDDVVRLWSEPRIAALKVLASLTTIPLDLVREDLRFLPRSQQTSWNGVLREFLIVDAHGQWVLPRLLVAAALTEPWMGELSAASRFASALIEGVAIDAIEDVVAVSRLLGDREAFETLIEERWLDLLAEAPVEAVRSCLEDIDSAAPLETPSAATFLRHLVLGLQGEESATQASHDLVRFSWQGDDPMLASVAEVCSRLLRFIGEGRRPVSGLDISERDREWPLPLLGLLRLDELASGSERGVREPERFEEAWSCLDLKNLRPEVADQTLLQRLALQTMAVLVSLRPELRGRLERRLATANEGLRRQVISWMGRAGGVPVQYRIRLLGPPEIERLLDGQPVERLDGSLHRETLLLARLALAGSTGAMRDELRTVVWADRSGEFFERNLHPTVSRLRATLRLDGDTYPDPIVVEQGVYRLASQYAWQVDVQALLEALQAAEDAEVARQSGRERWWLERVVALDRGAFMPGFEEPWPAGMRQRLQRRRAHAYRRLADLLEAAGQPSRAVDLLRQVLVDAPADEQAHRRLMELYRGAGRRDLVLRQYEILVATLESLGVVPDEETGLLFRELMR